MKTTIREAIQADIESILDFMKGYYEFDNLNYSREKSENTLMEFIGSNAGSVFIVELEGKPIGYFCLAFGYSLELHGRDCFLDEIYIEHEFRHKGYGTEIMQYVEKYLKSLDVKALHLIVFEHNTAARNYYTKTGFRTRDAIFMTKKIINN